MDKKRLLEIAGVQLNEDNVETFEQSTLLDVVGHLLWRRPDHRNSQLEYEGTNETSRKIFDELTKRFGQPVNDHTLLNRVVWKDVDTGNFITMKKGDGSTTLYPIYATSYKPH